MVQLLQMNSPKFKTKVKSESIVKDTELHIRPFCLYSFTHTHISVIFRTKRAELRLHIQSDLNLLITKCQIPCFIIRFIFHLDKNSCLFWNMKCGDDSLRHFFCHYWGFLCHQVATQLQPPSPLRVGFIPKTSKFSVTYKFVTKS